MRYSAAKRLHNEDEVMVKNTGKYLNVVSVNVQPKNVLVLCDDGNTYSNRDIK